MLSYALVVLLCVPLVACEINVVANNASMNVCWRDTYGRGAGNIPRSCKETWERSGALCYPVCQTNYTGAGPVCWENCPAGFKDIGPICRLSSESYYPCPWYDICGLTFAKGCLQCSRDGFKRSGCGCKIPGKTTVKKSYGRGFGSFPGCTNEQQKNGLLCYDHCKDDFIGVGPVCWRNGSGQATFEFQCNPFAYGQSKEACAELNGLLKTAGIKTAQCISSLIASIIAGQVTGAKACVDLIKQVLPMLVRTRVCHKVGAIPLDDLASYMME